ncbi:sensor histidine kinase [Metabacillus malikii]|uniref:histidine kinase n=1 Tax=Metabacillus malikii TaxID=1504265 RepID=A0ABT9ZER1_9BACI|nr:sensor histidine kinase [Metabacillus malikii]MDQ0230743.1 two-component system sensor histidine kinase YesM [Metabacillus malikii]
MKKNVATFLIKTINDLKLRDKLMVIFISVVFIPIFVVGIVLTNELRDDAITDAIELSKLNVERVKKRTVDLLNVPIYVSNNLQFDQKLSSLVNKKYDNTFDVVAEYLDYKTFDYYLHYYSSIENIKLYIDNPTLMSNWEIIPINEHAAGANLYHLASDDPAYNRWYYLTDNTKNNNPYLSLVRRINFLDYKTYGVLVVTVNIRQVNMILEQEPYLTMIVDDANHIIAANQPDFIGERMDGIIDPKHEITSDTMIIEGEFEGEASRFIIDHLRPEMSQNELKIISVVTEKEIVKDANKLGLLGAIVTIAGVVFAIILIVIVSWLLSKRLSNLSKSLDKVSKGDLSARIVVDGDDEIGQLSMQFNQMVENIHQLIEQVQDATQQRNLLEIRQKEIKLKMMASQINPHFLFNTLESIRMKAFMKGEKDIAMVVKQLGKLMRKSLEVGGNTIPLRNEIEMVRCYLEIQKFRYENRLNYQLSVDPNTEEIPIYPLIIQPLVENAVIHGLEDREDGGTVTVSTHLDESNLLVTVEDNGSGIQPEKLSSIQEMLLNPNELDGNRIGLLNVHNRLRLSYGDDSGLKITSTVGKGTKIQFTIRGD